MSSQVVRSIAVLGIFALLDVSRVAHAAEVPSHKAGLWETTMTLNGGAPTVKKLCFAPEWEKKMLELTVKSCAKYEVKKEGSSWVVESECDLGGQRYTGKTVSSGDFTSTVQSESTSTSKDGAKTTMKTDAKWVGVCGPNDKPGSIVR
ncbi:MAG: DUF3617 family protein [Deltaproteobacteria bacterium]|nr:DUF3617 family protein [Deltaproteobacteria bacterium]